MSFHIAVILPERYRGGTLRGAKNIARMINAGARQEGEDIRVTFAYVDDDTVYESADFSDLRDEGIGVRPFQLTSLKSEFLNPYFGNGIEPVRSPSSGEYIVFNDGMSNLEDADFWILVSDRVALPLPPHRRYAVVVYDYIQRYVPEIFGAGSENEAAWRTFDSFARAAVEAEFVICTTKQTRQDCISYAGADPSRVIVFPMEFDPILPEIPVRHGADLVVEKPYILWTTNSTQHKNHINMLEGLERFFKQNPSSDLTVRMSGVYTHLFSVVDGKGDKFFDHPYAKQVRRKLSELPMVGERLTILGNVPDDAYIRELCGASFVLHGALYDNGTYSVVEGAFHGIPSISSDYPAMRELAENFSLPLIFFDSRRPQSLADAIRHALTGRDTLTKSLPTVDKLRERSFGAIAPKYWVRLRQALNEFRR